MTNMKTKQISTTKCEILLVDAGITDVKLAKISWSSGMLYLTATHKHPIDYLGTYKFEQRFPQGNWHYLNTVSTLESIKDKELINEIYNNNLTGFCSKTTLVFEKK